MSRLLKLSLEWAQASRFDGSAAASAPIGAILRALRTTLSFRESLKDLDMIPPIRLVLLVILFPCAAFAGELRDLGEVRKVTDAAMQFITKDDVRGAVSSLRPYWTIVTDAEIEAAVTKVLEKRKAVSPRYGRIIGVQFVEQQVVADSYVRFIYIEKREKHLIRWLFYFYRPLSRWHLNMFLVDDQAQALFH